MQTRDAEGDGVIVDGFNDYSLKEGGGACRSAGGGGGWTGELEV